MRPASYREADKRVRELADVFAELARVGRRIPLRGLAPADIEAYVATVTESTVSRRAVARLHEVTGGNPYFLGEVVSLLAAGDTLDSLDEPARDPLLRIPEEVRALIRRRVAALPREAVAALRLAAVIGREFDLHLLQRASRLSPPRTMAMLGAAATVGLIAEVSATPRRYSFSHDLVRATLYGDLPPRRRLEFHQSVGRLLESAHGDDLDPHLSEIANHLFLAAPLGDAGRAVEYLVRAGDRASAVLGYEDAAIHYRRALELLERVGLRDWRFAFQSAGNTGEPWLGPDIVDYLETLHSEGVRNVLSVPIGFVSDHLEILFDIDVEAKEKAAALGMTLHRTQMPNARPEFIEVLASVVREHLQLGETATDASSAIRSTHWSPRAGIASGE